MRIIFLSLFFLAGCAHATPDKICVATTHQIVASARLGGFSASLDAKESWRALGPVHAGGDVVCPYEYVNIWGESGRATTRLVFFSPDSRYLGSYALTAPQKISATDREILITSMEGVVDVVDLGNGLPSEIFVDGEALQKFL